MPESVAEQLCPSATTKLRSMAVEVLPHPVGDGGATDLVMSPRLPSSETTQGD